MRNAKYMIDMRTRSLIRDIQIQSVCMRGVCVKILKIPLELIRTANRKLISADRKYGNVSFNFIYIVGIERGQIFPKIGLHRS